MSHTDMFDYSTAIRILLASLLAVPALSGCVEQDSIFTQGRIQTTCNGAIPICDSRAACVVGDDVYVDGTFPGGQKTIVRTQTDKNRLIVRFLLREMLNPGTEILVRAHSPSCNYFDDQHPQDVDLFERAGDDRVLEFQLNLRGEGDHLLEIFSDMAADYTMTTTVQDKS